MSSNIKSAIVEEVESHDGELLGTMNLQITLNARRKSFLLNCIRALQADEVLEIIPSNGGRGRMTIYRCPFSKCAHCRRLTCSRRPTRAALGYPRRARKPR